MSGTDFVAEARRWLRYATEDLASAKALAASDETTPRQPCWLAQQAAEKALKATLIALGTDFPRSHDLDLLCNLLPADRRAWLPTSDLAELTEWAVEARYPGDWPEATPADAARAIATAEQVVHAVQTELLRLAKGA